MHKPLSEPWRILHIDDDEDDHIIVKSMLCRAEGRNVSLDWAATLEEGRQKLEANHYQAVLVDYDLGVGTGIDLIREFVRRDYAAPLILLTGRGSYQVDLEAMHAGATLYLTKNEINPLLLERSIRYAIERKQTEQDLRERDQKLTVAIDAAQLGTWTYSFIDHSLEMDPRAQAMYRSEQPVESHDRVVEAYLHPEDAPAVWAALEKAADPNGEGYYQTEYRILQPDGSERWLNAWGQTEFVGQGAERRAVRLTGASRDITWEKQSRLALEQSNAALREREAELHESETRFRDLANNISQLAWMADESGRVFWYNQRWFDYTGTTLEEMQGWGWQKVHHPDHVQRVIEKISECFRTGQFWEDTFPLRGVDGTYRWFLSRAVPIKDEQGRVVRWFGTNTDVTSQLELQQQLKEQNVVLRRSEERFARIFESNPAGLAISQVSDGRYIDVNENFCQIFGYSRQEMIGRTSTDLQIFTDPAVRDVLLQRLGTEGRLRNVEMAFRARSGEVRYLLVSVELLKNNGQDVLLSSCIDISERKQAEAAVSENEARLRNLVDANLVGMVIGDATGQLTQANDYYLNLLGYTRQEFEAGLVNWKALTPVEHLPSDERAIAEMEQVGRCTPYEKEYFRKDGMRAWAFLSYAQLPSGEIIAVVVDITERKRVEQALNESEQFANKVLEASQNGLYIYDTALRKIVFINPQYTRLTGYTLEDLQAMLAETFLAKFHPEDRSRVRAHMDAVHQAAGGEVREIEYRFQCKDGGWMWANSYESVFTRGLDGKVKEYIGTFIDITGRKRSEAAVRESEGRLHLALDAARMVAWEYDPATQAVTLSENAEEVLALPRRHTNSNQGYSLIHPDDVEHHRELVEEAIATGGSYVSEYRHDHHGQVIWLEEHGRAVVDSSGKTIRLVGVVQNITGRKQTEAALRRLESRWNAAIESFSEGVIIATEDEQVIYWNPAAQEMHGFTRLDEGIEPLEKTPITFQLWTPDGSHLLELDEWPMRRLKRGETVRNLELRIHRPDQGWEKIFSYSGAMVHTTGGERLIFLTCHDMTEQRRVEQALQESEERLSSLANAMPQLVWTALPDGTVDYYNQRYQLYGGIAPVEQNRWEWGPVLHPDDLQPTVDAWLRSVETGEIYQIEHQVQMADGSYRWHLSRGIPARNDQGKLVKWYGTATDIHDYKEVQETLRQREQRMRRLFDSNLIGIFSRDAAGNVIEANDAYLRIIGYTCADVETGRVNVRKITPPEFHALDREYSERAAIQGSCRPYEKEYLRKDGTRVPVLIGYSLFEGKQNEFIGIVLDLSELKQAQAKLLSYADKLKRSNEELENFAFMASHDLQEPLRKVLLFGSSLRRQLKGQLSEEAEEYLDRMQNAAERMQAMIDGLLDLSRVNTRGSDFERVRLTAIAQEVVADLEVQIESTGGQVVVGDLPAVQGDALQLRQLLHNLVENALKYHRAGIPPVVQVTGETVREGKTKQVRIVVADNGIGFEGAQAEKIFQPFIRLHGRQYEGSGIGLAICRKIVERHGGTLTATGQAGEGSRFIITLPAFI